MVSLVSSSCLLLLTVGYLAVVFAFQRPLCPSQSAFKARKRRSALHLVPISTQKYGIHKNLVPQRRVSSSNSNPLLFEKNEDDEEYHAKLETLNNAIKAAEEEREKLRQARQKNQSLPKTDFREKKENGLSWEGWDENANLNVVPVEEWRGGELKQPPPSFPTRTTVTRSDAGTLVVDITPQGITSGVLFNGAFSVAWFSAIIPATVTALSGGLLGVALFMVPFWAAGGFVAKQAVVDPFVSSRVSIGQFAWSVESRLGGEKNAASISKHDGSTEDLRGARVECNLVVNETPQFALCLYSSNGVTKLGLGLPEEELEKVATEINDYLASISNEDRTNALKSWREISNEQ